MSQVVTISDELADVAALVKAGNKAQAKRQMSAVLDNGEAELLVIVGRCASTLEKYPFRIALQKLRDAWLNDTDPAHRAVIAACVPEENSGQYLRQVETRYEQDADRWPNDLTTRVDKKRKHGKKKAKRAERQAKQNAAAARYTAERGGVADGPQLVEREQRERAEQVYGSGLDYDKAGVHAVRGLPCVFCWCERAITDATTARARAGRGDDGLCLECRERGHAGIPEQPAGHTPADAIRARLSHILARCVVLSPDNWATAARQLLRREWERQTDPRAHSVMRAWAAENPLPKDEPAQPEHAEPGTPAVTVSDAAPDHPEAATTVPGACGVCGTFRQVRDDLCPDCRQLDSAADAAAGLDSCDCCESARSARDVHGMTADDGFCVECRAAAAAALTAPELAAA